MELQEFRRRYFEAKRQCVKLTAPLILESLPATHMCFITLAPDYRIGDLKGDERLRDWYDTFRKVGKTCAHEEDSMVNWLCRDDFAPLAPRSIDIIIYGATAIHTTFEFLVTGAFSWPVIIDTAQPQARPLAPWVPKPPRTPPGWTSIAESGRFSINWHKKKAASAV